MKDPNFSTYGFIDDNESLKNEFPLYDARNEHDACGIGFIVNINGNKTHDIVLKGIEILINLTHRGASGSDPDTGDGAGIMIQIPHDLFLRECDKLGFSLPAEGEYGVGMIFLPVEPQPRFQCEAFVERIIEEEGLTVLGWRDTPVDADAIGRLARVSQPYIEQVFIKKPFNITREEFDRKLYVIRKRAEKEILSSDIKDRTFFYIPSMSSWTIVYKGLLLAPQISRFYKDLSDPDTISALCLVHQRFSTNTFPSWPLAQPFRYICHNGEINTLRGNINWMYARQSVLKSEVLANDIEKLFPIIQPGGSDSAALDNVAELMVMAGRSLPHVMTMLIPEAWEKNHNMPDEKKAYYEYHASLIEPWDGPAAIAFTDGRVIGALLDRNGLRPARYLITNDDVLIMASETGVIDVPPKNVKMKGILEPGTMLLADLEQKRIVPDKEIKEKLAKKQPYRKWIVDNQIRLSLLPEPPREFGLSAEDLTRRQRLFGYTEEDLRIVLAPMVENGEEPVGSMGADTPLACISDKPQLLFNYFKQNFAQVTNPAIDSIREEIVMSLTSYIGTEGNLLAETPQHCHILKLDEPILTNRDLEKIRRVSTGDFLATTLPMLYRVGGGKDELERALDGLCRRASLAVKSGYTILILSDRGYDEEYAPIPSLLALSAVHHHLIREKTRTQVALIVESGEPREVMHFCLLIGFGASAVNPYLAFETIEDLVKKEYFQKDIKVEQAIYNYKKAVNKGILKTMSKMGISTLQSYHGAQVFEAIGISKELIDKYFTGVVSRIGGIGLEEIAKETKMRYDFAFRTISEYEPKLDIGGVYRYRVNGERHMINPLTITKIQQAVRQKDRKSYEDYSNHLNNQNEFFYNLRGLIEFKKTGKSIPIEEVEPASEIVKRFVTGAMSFGSISKEAHETLAIAMNRIGAKSNTGEGGEDEERFKPDPDGSFRRSAIKQIASGRFGVTATYLVNADEIQIKIAQGAKPGEGGQLPGHKVDEIIAKTRHSIPGVQLISPPPHHDIYSIEDLAQLIYDLKCVNPNARISVKLVAENGVGTVAAGVAKAGADAILISGDSGGTGAAPLSSIRHAGIPWEIGLAETQQVLVLNDLRGRVRLQVDGKLMTGRDVAIAALLGAEEFGFATTPLISLGCVMVRNCHLNTCPVGIATQHPELRKKFKGAPEHVINFFFFIAEELREIMAELGFRKVDEMVGRVDLLLPRKTEHWKAKHIDLSYVLYNPQAPSRFSRRFQGRYQYELNDLIDFELIQKAKPALDGHQSVNIETNIRNSHRAVGAMLSGEVVKRYGSTGLPDNTISIHIKGSAGQSFGAFLAKGITMALEGDANDYVGKGLSGGKLIVYPPRNSKFLPEENVIVGNVVLYGATSGEAYFNGRAGARFAVRNSGAVAVVEGVGEHGCEYMTGGIVLVLGKTGRNFGAGMSGGIAYVIDETGEFSSELCNKSIVDIDPLNENDETIIKKLVENHLQYTQSKRALQILDNWDAIIKKFVKVFPHDYKKVMGIPIRSAEKKSLKETIIEEI